MLKFWEGDCQIYFIKFYQQYEEESTEREVLLRQNSQKSYHLLGKGDGMAILYAQCLY